MIQAVFGYIAKLFITSMLCFCALAIAGGGAQKEAVRLACACMMIIALLGGAPEIDFAELLPDKLELEQGVSAAITDTGTYAAYAIAMQVEEYLERRAQIIGLECNVEILYTMSNDTSIEITGATVTHSGAGGEKAQQVRTMIAQECLLDITKITVMEEGT